MNVNIIIIALTLFSNAAMSAESIGKNNSTPSQPVFGLIERAILTPGELPLDVKMDTGALTSSLDARNIEVFNKNGVNWVRFDIETIDGKSNNIITTFERKIIRTVKIRGAGGSDERKAVLLNICIGHQSSEEQFTLRDRSEMKFPVIIGRRTIEHLGLIDVKRKFTVEPKCVN